MLHSMKSWLVNDGIHYGILIVHGLLNHPLQTTPITRGPSLPSWLIWLPFLEPVLLVHFELTHGGRTCSRVPSQELDVIILVIPSLARSQLAQNPPITVVFYGGGSNMHMGSLPLEPSGAREWACTMS